MKQALRTIVCVFALACAPGAQAFDDSPAPPYLPSPEAVVEKMLEVAGVKPDDFVVDLGSGDGRIVIAAAKKFGARGLGVEIDPALVKQAEEAARAAGVADRVKFVAGDMFEADLREATVLTLYLLPEFNRKLRPKILAEMKPGTRVVAHEFGMGGEWEPDRTQRVIAREAWTGFDRERNIYFWVVPARVKGAWEIVRDGAGTFSVDFEQYSQKLYGDVRGASGTGKVGSGRLAGAEIRFTLSGAPGLAGEYIGTVEGDGMRGRYTAPGGGGAWRASRAKESQ